MTQDVFTSSGTFTPAAGVTSVDVLVVGGGGAGNSGGATGSPGGGGAGGVRWVTGISVTPGTPVTVTVGAAGSGGNGGASSFGATSATGGGLGGSSATGNSGGSGGGAGSTSGSGGSVGGSGTAGQGSNGGGGVNNSTASLRGAGGGGGAGAVGGSGGTNSGGAGGAGVNMSANVGTSVGVSGWFGGGGGGCGGGQFDTTFGVGGQGGGGAGSSRNGTATSGTVNTGGGGGGGGTGGNGGKGIVIVVYSVGGSPTTISGTQATETDTAQPGTVTVGTRITGGQATETDAALAGTVSSGAFVIAGGQAQETDTALAGTVFANVTLISGGQAIETDEALPGSVVLSYGATDTFNRIGGRRRGGYAVATWEPPVATPPAGIVLGEARDRANAFGPVTMNGTQAVYNADTATRQRHRNRIVVGGKDITYWRDVQTPLPTYQLVSPLLYGPATLRLPQVAAAFEWLGHGALSWLQPGKTVLIQRVDPDTGDVVATDYKGVVIAFDTSGRDLTVELGGEASGRAALQERQLPLFRGTSDIGQFAYRAISDYLGLPFEPRLGPNTGIKLGRFGGTGLLDYISQLCARAWTRSGTQWTVAPVGGVYKMFRKDLTTIDATAYLDDARTVGDLRRDLAEEPNRFFVTGVTPEGQRIRFGAYPGLKQSKAAPYPFNNNRNFGTGTTNEDTDTGDGITVMIGRLRVVKYMDADETPGGYDGNAAGGIRQLQDDAGLPVTGTMTPATWRALWDLDATGFSLRWSRILPAAQRAYTKPWILSASGGVMRRNPLYDRSRLKVDRTIDMGSGLTISQMREFAMAERDAGEDNWVGTITFHTGALVSGSHGHSFAPTGDDVFRARRLKPGMNIRLPHSPGGDITVHISAVSVDEDGKVTATVDTRARDSMAVWEIINRNRESRANPARQWIHEHRASGTLKDAVDGWDEVGGLLGDKVTVPGHQWTVFEVVAGQEGTVARLAMNTAPNAEFVVAVFGRKIGGKHLGQMIGNPLTKKGAKNWASEGVRNKLDQSHILLYVAGDSEQPCGYFPRVKRPDTVIVDETNPDYDPSADPDSTGTDDEPTIEVEHETGSITPLTGRWKDDAGFGYRTFRQPVIYVAVYADRDTTIPAGRIMWPQLEAGA